MRVRSWTRVLGIGLALAGASRAHAAEGVFEINASCAAVGCFPGDAGAFPVSITQAGSYRLTSDLFHPSDSEPVIHVVAEAVTIDLNGFSVVGPGVPELGGNASAILGGHRVAVRNGFVRFASGSGVQLGGSSRVEDLHVHGSSRDGVSIAGEGTVRNVVATSNLGNGIAAGAASAIDGCTATANGGNGIALASGTVRGSTATQNTGKGGDFGAKVTFATNLFDANGGGDVAGGHASGGNLCGDLRCTSDGRKQYYLTNFGFPASQAKAACLAGFHMASLTEILDPSNLQYALLDPLIAARAEQDARGAPHPEGWVRTVYQLGSGVGPPGQANCFSYSSFANATEFGTVARLTSDWTTAPLSVSPWSTRTETCLTNVRVWCVED